MPTFILFFILPLLWAPCRYGHDRVAALLALIPAAALTLLDLDLTVDLKHLAAGSNTVAILLMFAFFWSACYLVIWLIRWYISKFKQRRK